MPHQINLACLRFFGNLKSQCSMPLPMKYNRPILLSSPNYVCLSHNPLTDLQVPVPQRQIVWGTNTNLGKIHCVPMVVIFFVKLFARFYLPWSHYYISSHIFLLICCSHLSLVPTFSHLPLFLLLLFLPCLSINIKYPSHHYPLLSSKCFSASVDTIFLHRYIIFDMIAGHYLRIIRGFLQFEEERCRKES